MIKKKRNSRALKILKGVGYAGLIVLAASNPYFGLNLISGIKRQNNKKAWRKFSESLRYLNRRSYVKIINRSDAGITVKITRKGEELVKELDIDSMQLKKQDSWDGRWRIIIYDVPNKKSKNRLAFAEKLKTLGFVMIQKSVWAYPFECYKELLILSTFY